METLRKIIKEALVKNYTISENLEYVKKYVGDSQQIKSAAESWAKQINNSPDTIKFNFSNDSTDFKRTSYMLEILMYAIAQGGEFVFPTTQEKIQVNPNNIARGIMLYMFPSYDYNKFAKFISGGDFKITGSELEYIDSEVPKMMKNLQETLIDISKTIQKYLNNGYFQENNKSFVNYLQTALRYPLRDARKYLKSHGTSSLDEPMGDKITRGDSLSSDYDLEKPDSYNDFNLHQAEYGDDDRYEPEVSDKLATILKLNSDINQMLIGKKALYEFFRLRIIGEGGNDKIFGNTFSYGDIKNAFRKDALLPELKNDISKKLLSFADKFLVKGYTVAKKGESNFIPGRLDLLQQLQKTNPESFNEKGQLIASPALLGLLEVNVKEDKLRPKTLFKRIRREIQDFFEDNDNRRSILNQLVSDAGLINPSTNQPFDGVGYLNTLLKSRTEKKEPQPIDNKNSTTVTVPITEEIIDEDILDEGMLDEGEDERFSFSDILKIAQASARNEKKSIQEMKNQIRNILLKNIV